jgi:hypothetical protein
LGAQDAGHARAAFEDAAASSTLLRAYAQLGLAQAHALAGETSREMEVLRRLLDGPAGEAEPAALERYAALCDRLAALRGHSRRASGCSGAGRGASRPRGSGRSRCGWQP